MATMGGNCPKCGVYITVEVTEEAARSRPLYFVHCPKCDAFDGYAYQHDITFSAIQEVELRRVDVHDRSRWRPRKHVPIFYKREKTPPVPPGILSMLDEVYRIEKEWGCIDSLIDHLYNCRDMELYSGDPGHWDYEEYIQEVEWLKTRYAYYVLFCPWGYSIDSV